MIYSENNTITFFGSTIHQLDDDEELKSKIASDERLLRRSNASQQAGRLLAEFESFI